MRGESHGTSWNSSGFSNQEKPRDVEIGWFTTFYETRYLLSPVCHYSRGPRIDDGCYYGRKAVYGVVH